MSIFDTYAKRKRAREQAGQPDVYEYDVVPNFLRKQIAMILDASFGPWYMHVGYGMVPPNGNETWQFLAETLERESESFPDRDQGNPQQRFLGCVFEADIDDWLSLVELACRVLTSMDGQGSEVQARKRGAKQKADDALIEINARFRESGFGYEFRNGEIIRIDDQYIHAEVVRPALSLLAERGFEKANEEFMAAHRNYREGNAKEAVVAANRAFESTLKAICSARRWECPAGARASELVTAVSKNGLFPAYLDAGMTTYVSLLKTGLPGVRNNAGGHGDGPDAPPVPLYLAAYALHLTAANIVLVMNAHLDK